MALPLALTPLGDGVRELLFPTKAALSGSVTMDERPVDGAVVALDGEDADHTDRSGAYLLTGVGNGFHVVEIRAPGAHQGQVAVAVQRGATEVTVNPLDLRPLVGLGYTIASLDLRPSAGQGSPGGFVLNYDFTLWIHGDTATLERVTTSPTPCRRRSRPRRSAPPRAAPRSATASPEVSRSTGCWGRQGWAPRARP